MYTLEYGIDVQKTCKKYPTKDKIALVEGLENLKKNPRPLSVKKLAGYENAYRVRVGHYRIIYEIYDKKLVVLIIDIHTRANIYKKI